MTAPLTQKTFTTIRSYPVPAARVFEALANPDQKRAWFAGPPGTKEIKREMDFTVGGRERFWGSLATAQSCFSTASTTTSWRMSASYAPM